MENYQYELVKKLSFNRVAGTQDESRTANILLDEIKRLGGDGHTVSFTIPGFTMEKCSMKVTAPYQKDIRVVPYGRCGVLPESGAEFGIHYVERGEEEDFAGLKDLSDTAILVNELKPDVYKRLCEHKAGAVLVIVGKYYEDLTEASAYPRILRDHFAKHGKLPVFMIAASDATEILRDGVSRVHLEMRQTEHEDTSRNVISVIPGTDIAEESIVLTAHYDSVPVGVGAWDNATGSATLMYIYHYFLKNPPRRTMRFIWCGAEELGLLGAKAYVDQNEEIINEIKFCFNFDMCGTVLGPNLIFVTGKPELETYVRQFCRHEGYSSDIRVCVHSSDSAPFADKGIPGIGLSRGTKSASIHTYRDQLFPLNSKQLEINGDFAVKMIDHVTNGTMLPVDPGMPEDILKELDKYFHRN